MALATGLKWPWPWPRARTMHAERLAARTTTIANLRIAVTIEQGSGHAQARIAAAKKAHCHSPLAGCGRAHRNRSFTAAARNTSRGLRADAADRRRARRVRQHFYRHR